MTAPEIAVIGGIDTHTDVHQAAVIDSVGRHLDTQPFETNSPGSSPPAASRSSRSTGRTERPGGPTASPI